MSLSDLTFKRTYDSYTDNIVDDFFNAALQETSLYRRAAAYFSSSTFKALSVGLGRLFSNGGKMEAIVSVILEEEDYEAIVRGIADREETIAKLFPDLQSAKNILEDSSVEALYRLIASSRLQMKFVLSKRGIFHMKFGIMQDESGKMISFSGSINETMQGYLINGEEFKVFREWAEGEREFVHDDLEKFNSYWNGKFPTKDVITSDLPSKVIQRISKLVEEATGKQKESGEYVPRPYQKEAASEWIKNGYRGIIEMATGTGKTNVAIDIIAQVLSRMQPLLVIISVPTKELLRQWSSAIESRIGVEAFEASAAKVKAALRSIDNLFWMPPEQKIFIMIGTYAYLSKASFGELFTKSGIEKLLIADEVHSAGAESFSRILREEYGMRLGLSATPARHFDDAGTEKIMGYFGGIVFSYTLEQAISDGYLVPFSYYPEFVDLTLNEMKSYLKLTRRYINMISKSDTEDDGLVGNPVDLILIQRAKITKKAANKFAKLGEIISKLAAESNLAIRSCIMKTKSSLSLETLSWTASGSRTA